VIRKEVVPIPVRVMTLDAKEGDVQLLEIHSLETPIDRSGPVRAIVWVNLAWSSSHYPCCWTDMIPSEESVGEDVVAVFDEEGVVMALVGVVAVVCLRR
jgi:hypothetical protein